MRRAEKEITDKLSMLEILNSAELLRVAMVDDGEPYLVVMNHAYSDGCIYLHSAKEGRKIDVLKKNNHVAFQTETNVEIVSGDDASRCSTSFLSVFGTGRALLLEDRAEKIKGLDAIMKKHTGKEGFEYPEKLFDRTLIIKIEIESMTGKKSG